MMIFFVLNEFLILVNPVFVSLYRAVIGHDLFGNLHVLPVLRLFGVSGEMSCVLVVTPGYQL